MEETMRKFANHPLHKKCDSTVVVILSHGKKDEIYGSNCVPIAINDLTSCLNAISSPVLIGKPKIFIIQACRGGKSFF